MQWPRRGHGMATHRRVRRSFLRFHDAASENNHKIMLNPGYLLPRAKQKAPRAYASHPDYEVVPDSWAAASRDRKHLLSQVRLCGRRTPPGSLGCVRGAAAAAPVRLSQRTLPCMLAPPCLFPPAFRTMTKCSSTGLRSCSVPPRRGQRARWSAGPARFRSGMAPGCRGWPLCWSATA